MAILVNFYSVNQPQAGTGQPLDILGAQTADGVLIDDGEYSTALDHDALALIQATTASWVRIGSAAVANQSEKIEAGDVRMRFLKAGDIIYCEAAASTQADIVLLTSLETKLAAIEDYLQSIDGNLATTATDIPPFVRKNAADLTFLPVALSASTTGSVLLAGTASQTIKVHRILLTISGACLLGLYDGDPTGSGTLLLNQRYTSAGGVLDVDSPAWPFPKEATSLAGLYIKLSANVNVDGVIGVKKG